MLMELMARARSLGLTDELEPSPDRVFRLVRDMPYERASDLSPSTLIREWRGTCSGKHLLLQALLSDLGLRVRLMIATYRYSWQGPGPVPRALAQLLAPGPVPDVHNFLEVQSLGAWLPLDATFPKPAAAIGFPVNDGFVPGVAQRVACTPPYSAWPVPPDVALDAYKAGVLAEFCGADLPRREAFIAALTAWSGAAKTRERP